MVIGGEAAGAGLSASENRCSVQSVAHHKLKILKKLESPDILCIFSLPVAEATDDRLKCFIRVIVKVSCL